MYRYVVTENRGKVRRAELNGRPHLVAPAVLLRPITKPGSSGPLYYPRNEIAKSADAWNGIPVTMRHPESGSARDPGTLAAIGVGRVYGATIDASGSLVAELWLDEAAVANHDLTLPDEWRVLPKLLAGEPVDVSTGLWLDTDPGSGVDSRGIAYDHTARNFKPDHLAILPDQRGACSVADGCGLMMA